MATTVALEARKSRAIRNWRHAPRLVGAYVLLLIGAVVMAVPFFWMVSISFQEPLAIGVWPPVLLPPWPLRVENYAKAMGALPFHLFFLNSFKIATLSVAGEILTCSLAAYSFARISFPGRDTIFLVLLATLMIPSQVTLIPIFIEMTRLGWVNTHLPLWVPSWTASAFGVFLLRQFFMTIPRELEDAAEIDGAGPITIWWRIVLPLSGAALATLAIFTFLRSWNDLIGPLVYVSDLDKYTVQLGLLFFKDPNRTDTIGLMAVSTASVLPTIAVFMATQRYFIRGIMLSGLKR